MEKEEEEEENLKKKKLNKEIKRDDRFSREDALGGSKESNTNRAQAVYSFDSLSLFFFGGGRSWLSSQLAQKS
jgi:hypothetical protein